MKLLRFHAEWCEPCKRLAPLIHALADRASLTVELVDVDQDPETAERYGVKSVPTVVLLDNDGQPVFTGTGASSLPGLQRALG